MANQLWVVFLDGVAQPSLQPFAESEKEALSLWLEKTGSSGIARSRLRAFPKDVEQSAPSPPPEGLTTEEQEALEAWALGHGRSWKAALRLAWETGNYHGSEHDAALQRIRNRLGPTWLIKYRLPLAPNEEMKGYRCWVRTRIKPNETRVWMATRRAEADSQVKTAVRNNRTEGGVESLDPGKPYEVTFAMVRGKLVQTKHTD